MPASIFDSMAPEPDDFEPPAYEPDPPPPPNANGAPRHFTDIADALRRGLEVTPAERAYYFAVSDFAPPAPETACPTCNARKAKLSEWGKRRHIERRDNAGKRQALIRPHVRSALKTNPRMSPAAIAKLIWKRLAPEDQGTFAADWDLVTSVTLDTLRKDVAGIKKQLGAEPR